MNTDLRLAAAKFLKDWSTWMITIEAALIAFLGSLLTADGSSGLDLCKAFKTVVAFGVSLAMAAWVLGALPSIVQRLASSPNDPLHSFGLFDFWPCKHLPLGVLTFLQHAFFLAGLVYLILAFRPLIQGG